MMRMGFKMVFNLVTIYYFSWGIINLTDIRSTRNIFRDLCPFSYLPKLLLHLRVSLQADLFLIKRKTVSGTTWFPLLCHEFRKRGRRLLYLPHNIRALVSLKHNGIEWPNFKSAGGKKIFLGCWFPLFLHISFCLCSSDVAFYVTDRHFFSSRNCAFLLGGRDEGKPKHQDPGSSLQSLRTHKLGLSLSQNGNSYHTASENKVVISLD